MDVPLMEGTTVDNGPFDLGLNDTPTKESVEPRFYMTYTRSRPSTLVPWIEDHQVPLLTNAKQRWSQAQSDFLPMWEYDTPHVIDAGGYNVQAAWMKHEDFRESATDDATDYYPWSVREYHDWLCEHDDEFEWATAMDYACEDRFNELWSVEDRIEATLENTLEHVNLDPEYQVLPVLQGRQVRDYVRCYEFYEDHGIDCDYVGLGTVCRLSSEKKIVELEKDIRALTNVEHIHGFGVKVDAYKHGATFDTADSQAWVYVASRGQIRQLERTNDGGLRMVTYDMKDDSLTRTVESFKNYYAYVSWLKDGTTALRSIPDRVVDENGWWCDET